MLEECFPRGVDTVAKRADHTEACDDYSFHVVIKIFMLYGSEGHHELWLSVVVVFVVFEHRLERHQTILTTYIDHVVNPPVHLSDSSSRMP